MSYHLYQTRGFVVKSVDIGEANRILSIFTEELGLLSVAVQAVRKHSSKLRPSLRDLSSARFVIVRGKNVWRLTDVSESTSFSPRCELERVKICARIFSLVSRFVQGEHPNKKLFSVLLSAYEFLREEELFTDELARLEILVALQILASLGYVGENSFLAPFLAVPISRELLQNFSPVSLDALREINRAIAESQL